MKYLGIDYGDKKIGLAIGDSESGLAMPYDIIENSGWSNIFEKLKMICEQEDIKKIVAGLPLQMAKQNPDHLAKIQKFICDLEEAVNINVVEEDETMTTRQASRDDKSGQEDDIAAMLILQSYLDKKKTESAR